MRILVRATDYKFSKTFFRNVYDGITNDSISNGRLFHMMKSVHYAKVPKSVQQNIVSYTTYVNDEGNSTSTPVYGPTFEISGGADFTNYIKTHINNNEPECKWSFICTMSKESGLISQEELDMLIDFKMRKILVDREGKRIVAEYKKFGLSVEQKIRNDISHRKVHQYMYDTWLRDIVELVKNDCSRNEFLVKYYAMVNWLKRRYNYAE